MKQKPVAAILVGSIAGCGVAVYLAMYQLRLIGHVWDPLFTGSPAILDSSLSRLLPIPDALLGGFAYALEAVAAGLILRIKQERRPKWFKALSVGLGVLGWCLGAVGIALVALQALVFHAWCTLCLCSAAISIVISILSTPSTIRMLCSARVEDQRSNPPQ